MSDLPAPIQAYLNTHIIANRYPAYLLVDRAGGLTEWGGRLEAYGIAGLQKGKDVGEQLFFLAGLLPLQGRPLFLPCLETESSGAVDLYIFPGEGGDWVLLLDATAEMLRLRSLRQKEHELRLMQENQPKDVDQHLLQDAALKTDLFAALDMLVLERLEDSSFRIVGAAPDWCKHVYPEASRGQDPLQPGKKFLFLENFLIDAQYFWHGNAAGQLRSGPWVEIDLSGNECYLEAAAIYVGLRKILLIEFLRIAYEERQSIIQTGREQSLAYHRLARAAEALRQSEERYRTLFESACDILFTLAPDRTITSLNPIFERITGWPRAEWIGKPFAAILHPDDVPLAMERFQRIVHGDRLPMLELRVRLRSGTYAVLELTGTVQMQQGRVARVLGIGRDITERKRTEEEIKKLNEDLERRVNERTVQLTAANQELENEIADRTRAQEQLTEDAEIFAALARVAQELIALLNAPTILERLCRLVTEVLECDRSSTVLWQPQEGAYVVAASYGNTPEQWEVIRTLKVPPEAVAEGIARLAREEVIELEIASPPQSIPAVILHQFGVTAALCLVLRRGQEVIGVQTAAYCGRKGFSSEQKRIAQGISQIASLALANAKLLEELERANRVKEDFVGTMSHELRTPLNIILGYNDLLLEGEFGDLGPEQLRVVQRVDKSARELVDLVTATLDLSRLQSQQLPLTLQEVQVAGLVEEVVTDIRSLNPKPTLSLRWETAPNLPLLRTDPLKLRVVLKNLITNAVKFTDQGSVSITAQRKGAGIEFCVTDTGIGIAPEALSVIFEPFRQLNNSTTRLHHGVGLGLYIVCQLLNLLEGTISVDSEVGKGSTFRVWLPLVAKRT